MARVHTGESTLARGVRIVESFGHDDRTLTVSDIARRAKLHVSTASRLVDELVRCGWLERDGRQVRVGVRLWEVAARASIEVGIREAAMPFMEDLQAVVGQHTQLAVLERQEVLFIERISAPGAAVNYSRIAGRLPMHASSSGLVLLAHGPHELQQRVLNGPLETYTDKTIHTERQLRSTLAHVRKQGFALCAGHIYPETTGIATPIHGRDGAVVAALGLVMPNDERAYAQIPALMAAARGISRVVGAAPPHSRVT